MSEKIYLANGKKFGQYANINLQIELDKVFAYIADNSEDKKKIGEAFDTIQKATKNMVGFAQFERNNGKTGIGLKLTVKEKKDSDEVYAELNTWVKDNSSNSQNNKPSQHDPSPQEDDLPF